MNDLKRSGTMIFLIATLLLSSGAFAPLWIDSSVADQAVEGTPVMQAVWGLVYCVVVGLLIARWREAWRLLSANFFILILLATCAFSAVWSENPAVTLRKTIALLGSTMVGVLLAVSFTCGEEVAVLATTLGMAAVASLIACLFCPQSYPATEFAGVAWNGVFSHKNLLGRAMSLGSLGFLSLNRSSLRNLLFSYGGTALCFAMLLMSHSQTALMVLFAMLVALVLSRILRWEWRVAGGIGLLLSALCLPLFWIATARVDVLFAMLDRNITFTGRARIWSFALLSFLRQPWLGYGYGAFWWVSSESRQALALIGYPTPHAHNGFLDLGLQLGFAGIALFLTGWGIAMYRAVRNYRTSPSQMDRWPLVYLLFVVLYSLTENSLLSPNSLLWILFVAACCRTSQTLHHAPSEALETLPL